MKDYDDSELKEIYLKVVKKFPGMKEEGITPMRHEGGNFIICITTPPPYLRYSMKSELIAGILFENFTYKEKEAIIAHELGHYEQSDKNQNNIRFLRQRAWDEDYNLHKRFRLFYKVAGLFSKKIKHKDERLKKRYLLAEIYADNKAAEAGYKEDLVSALKKILSLYAFSVDTREKINIRIKNLEEKLNGQ